MPTNEIDGIIELRALLLLQSSLGCSQQTLNRRCR